MLTITVLAENSDGKGLCGEHGLSLHIEYEGRRYLLDAGATGLFAENAHAKVYLQEAAAENCYSEKAGAREYIGIPRGILREHADRFCFVSGASGCFVASLADAKPVPGIWILPHTTPNLEEQGRKAHMYRLEDGRFKIDDFAHEQSVTFETEKGLILCNSCSHGGIVNIVKEAQRALHKNVYAVVGGFHLKSPDGVDSMAVSPEEVEDIGRQLVELGVKQIYTGHCTGGPALGILQQCFPKEVHSLHTGMQLNF